MSCRVGALDEYEFNFLTNLSRTLLERLATASVEASCSAKIKRLYDMYTNFIALEDNMFTLRHQNCEPISYFAMYNEAARDAEIESSINTITDSLFSACISLGRVPIIQCPRGLAAQHIATRLDEKIRAHLKNSRGTLFAEGMSATGR